MAQPKNPRNAPKGAADRPDSAGQQSMEELAPNAAVGTAEAPAGDDGNPADPFEENLDPDSGTDNPQDDPGSDPDDSGANGNGEDGEHALATAAEFVPTGYAALDLRNQAFLHEIMTDNLAGDGLTARDLPRVTVPPGGMKFWTIKTPEGDHPVQSLEGIIVHWDQPRAWWEKSPEESGGSTPPDCSSPDGKVGTDVNGVTYACGPCRLNQFGSAPNGRGKACKEKRMLYVLMPDRMLPTVVQAPSTSIAPIREYFVRLIDGEDPRPYWATKTQLSLETITPGDGFPYSKIVAKSLGPLDEAQVERARAYRDSIRPNLQRTTAIVQDE